MPDVVKVLIPVRLDGLHRCDELWVFDSGRIATEAGVVLISKGDVFIFGEIRGARGASIHIESQTGNIAVFGSIHAGDGENATQPGAHGTPGGHVELVAPKGEVLIVGQVQSGRGGNGADARNHPLPSDTRAGDGAAGGVIRIHGGTITIRNGQLTTGIGGNGGSAYADGWTIRQWLDWTSEHWVVGGPMDLPGPPPDPPIVIRTAEGATSLVSALSGRGGYGGDIVLVLGDQGNLGHCSSGSALSTGNGGSAGKAEAVRGAQAQAVVGEPGFGGSIRFEVGTGMGVWTRTGKEQPGKGGNAGGATAGGNLRGDLIIPQGGKGGEVVPQLSIAPGARGDGGNVGRAHATSDGCSRTKGPNMGNAAGPGKGISIHCP